MTHPTRINIAIFSIAIGMALGGLIVSIWADSQVNKMKQAGRIVTCIEHVTIDGRAECSIFEYRGEMYATEYAPIIDMLTSAR